jgi:catechol 2,3-dioxygenase-like lactoylglutathione lyase family enzyme
MHACIKCQYSSTLIGAQTEGSIMTHWPTARITHIGLNVRDLATSVDFYSRCMGMKVMKSADGRFATVSFGYQHHDIALIPARLPPTAPSPVGMNHFAVEVRDYAELVQFTGRLMDAGVAIERAIDHRTGMGVYFKDPDGNSLELWCENFPSMERAIDFGDEMTEEFEENHIGYPLDIAQLHRDYQTMVRAGVKPGEPAMQADPECLA